MSERLSTFGAIAVAAAFVAAPAMALDQPTGSSVTIINETHAPIAPMLTKTIEDEGWDSDTLDADDYMVLDCGGCVVDGFELKVNGPGSHRFFLKSGKEFVVKVLNSRPVVYEVPSGTAHTRELSASME